MLGPPLTFALSQDQTLRRKFEPALHRDWLLKTRCVVPGGKTRTSRCGFGFLQTETQRIFVRNLLAIQFSETDRKVGPRWLPLPFPPAFVVGDAAYRGSPLFGQLGSRKFFRDPLFFFQPLEPIWEFWFP